MGTPSKMAATAIAIDDDAAALANFDAGSFRLEFLSESLRLYRTVTGGEGIRGSRSRNIARAREVARDVRGSLVLNPTPGELDILLPWILGTAESSDVFALGESPPVKDMLIDRVAKRFVYSDLVVAKATFRCQQGGLLELTLDLEGKDESTSASSFPGTVPAIDATGVPYHFGEATFALGADASAAEIRSIELVIDNMVDANRRMNAKTRASIPALDRLITYTVEVPYTADEIDLHDSSDAGATNTLTFTNGNRSILFSMVSCVADDFGGPTASTRNGEITQRISHTCYRSGSTLELVTTSDASG
jgi:hypothetical protein